jgi:RNA polymerase sigma-70 factor (ECF subfamily)
VATNLSLDLLRQRRRRSYQGSWLPSPVETTDEEAVFDVTTPSTEARYEWVESLSFAFLLALEALTPRQRAVLLLRDVFDYSARATAELLDLSEENIRITHHRARRAMRDYDRNRCQPTSTLQEQTRQVLGQFIRCLLTQDVDGATALLTASARTVTDGGSEYTALHRPLVGRKAVLTLHLRVAQRRGTGARIECRVMNGLPAIVIEYASAVKRQAPRAVLRCELDADGHISELHTILASRKLTAVRF